MVLTLLTVAASRMPIRIGVGTTISRRRGNSSISRPCAGCGAGGEKINKEKKRIRREEKR